MQLILLDYTPRRIFLFVVAVWKRRFTVVVSRRVQLQQLLSSASSGSATNRTARTVAFFSILRSLVISVVSDRAARARVRLDGSADLSVQLMMPCRWSPLAD